MQPCQKLPRVRKGLLLGILVLLVVDILWVGSAGLTRYLFTIGSYEKPFFTTYFKTSLFSIYLSAFIFWRPWQRLCCCCVSRARTYGVANQEEDRAHSESHDRSHDLEEDDSEACQGGVAASDDNDGISETANAGGVFRVGGAPNEVGGAPNEVGGVSEELEGAEEDVCEDGSVTVHLPSTNSASCGETSAEIQASGRPLKFTPRVPSMDKCPLPPDNDVCLLGPPELGPLCCDLSDVSLREREQGLPISPCFHKCCKVRFRPTVEIREMRGKPSSPTRKFDRSRDCEKFVKRKKPVDLLPVHKVLPLSLIFGILWFFANYLYGLALDHTSVAMVNTLSASSGVFVMCLVGIPLLATSDGDKFTIPRCLVTLLTVLGAVLVSLSPSGKDGQDEKHKFNAGALLALGGAVLYALYLVLLRKMLKEPESLEIPMFFGFVGLFDFLLLLPLMLIWHFSGLETFEMPDTDVWTLLLVNGFVGTVLSELLWLWGVFLTSPLVGTLALSLVTPLSILYSIFVGKASFSWMFAVGAVLIILGFVGVAVLEHLGAWDPVWKLVKKYYFQSRDNSSNWWAESVPPESQQLLPDSPPPVQ